MSSHFDLIPREISGQDNTSTLYYIEEILKLIYGNFRFRNAPEDWAHDYMLDSIFRNGEFTITDTSLGVVPLKCGHTGINIYSEPIKVVVANAVLGSFERTIGVDCALIKLQHNFGTVLPTVKRYAYFLAACDSALAVNLLNSKVAFIGEGESRAQVATLQKLYDDITSGKPAAFYRKDDGTNFTLFNVSNTFIADRIIEAKKLVLAELLTKIGINTANTMKKERENLDEVNVNNQETLINVEHWISTVNEGLAVANRLYGLDIVFEQVQKDQSILKGGSPDGKLD